MKKYNSLKDLKEAPEAICKYYETFYKGMNLTGDAFDAELGGSVCIVEEVKDLKEISSGYEKAEGGYLSLLEHSGLFDYCGWDTTADNAADFGFKGDYFFIFYATNNAGGPTFWIPREIALSVPNVLNSTCDRY
jgi:hypothetical protein